MSNLTKRVLTKLFIASGIAFLFCAAEVVGGLISSSLAILTDAAHMASDLVGFFISIFSVWIATKSHSKNLSYGYNRSEVIGALASIMIIWAITVFLIYEATTRIINKTYVDNPVIMLITAGGGLIVNLIMAKVLHAPTPKSQND